MQGRARTQNTESMFEYSCPTSLADAEAVTQQTFERLFMQAK